MTPIALLMFAGRAGAAPLNIRKALGSAALGKLIGVQNLDGAIKVQTDSAKTARDALVAGCSRFGELFAAVAEDAHKPFESSLEQAQAPVR